MSNAGGDNFFHWYKRERPRTRTSRFRETGPEGDHGAQERKVMVIFYLLHRVGVRSIMNNKYIDKYQTF